MNRFAALLILLAIAALAIHCTRVVVLTPAPDAGYEGSGDAAIHVPDDAGSLGG